MILVNKNVDKGLDILLNTYWSSKGWKNGKISKEDFAYAKKKGYMFDYPIFETHDNTLKKLNDLLPKVNCMEVSNAFFV